MKDLYQERDKAFKNVAAYVIMFASVPVARIAVKFPKDGAGRLYCYLHIYGDGLKRGMAKGYGYDKTSAAIENAAEQFKDSPLADRLKNLGGGNLDSILDRAGYQVITAI